MEEPEITAWNNHLHCNPQWAAPHCLQFELCFFPPAPCHQYRQMGLVCIAMASLMKCLDLWWLKETLSIAKKFWAFIKDIFSTIYRNMHCKWDDDTNQCSQSKIQEQHQKSENKLYFLPLEKHRWSLAAEQEQRPHDVAAVRCYVHCMTRLTLWKQQCLVINQPELVHEAPTRATTQKSMYMPQFHVIAWLGGLITPYSWGVSDTLTHKPLPRNL